LILNVAAIHHTFPDGSQFEGVGIGSGPDVSADPMIFARGATLS
jgi:hypothetical protein